MRAYNNYLDKEELATVITTTTSAERRKRLRLKRIVVSEHNYLALKRLGQAGDSFNDVISKLLRIERIYEEKRQQRIQQQQERNKEKHVANNGVPFSTNLSSELFGYDRQQLERLMGPRGSKISGANNQRINQEE